MPKFNNREEYEQWKKEKLKSNIEGSQRPEQEKEETKFSLPPPSASPQTIQPVSTTTAELRSIGDLFRESWEIYKSRFVTLIVLYLLSIAFVLFLTGIFTGLGFLFSELFPGNKPAFIAAGVMVGIIPGLVAMFWGLAAFTFAVVDSTLGIKDALGKGWDKAFSFLWVSLLLGFLITGGFFLLVIPGIVFLIWFIFAQFILASEDERGMNAILKSKEYVRGRWFDVFLRLFIIWLISAIVGLVPIIGPIVSLLFFPFIMIFSFLVYEDLKAIKGVQLLYPHLSGEKFKWIGIGALGYIFLPLLLIGILGTTLTIPFLMLKPMLNPQNQDTIITPQQIPPFGYEPPQGEQGYPSQPEASKSAASGEALIVLDGNQETYVLQTGFMSDTRLSNPRRATIQFQFPAERNSNSRRIQMTLDATRTGEHFADGKNYSIFNEDKVAIGELTPSGLSAIFVFVADGGQIFPPKDSCPIIISSPYSGTPEGVFSGEVTNCFVHSAGIDHTISARFTMRGMPSH